MLGLEIGMFSRENTAAKRGNPGSGAHGDLVEAVETIISALVEITRWDPIAAEEPANLSPATKNGANMAGRQTAIVVCPREDGLSMVNRGRAMFARDYILQLFETMAGLMAEGRRSLTRFPSQTDALVGAASSGHWPLAENCFRRDGMYWTLAYKGKEALVAHSKGLHYVAQLLSHPGREIHVLHLAAGAVSTDATIGAVDLSTTEMGESNDAAISYSESLGDAGALLDKQAKSTYRRRLTELREELSAAKELGDEQRTLALEEEIDALIGELRRAIGLRGRDRKAASATERARVNATRAIKLALQRIGRVHAELETHLLASVKTGTFCRYQPSPETLVTWYT
jgi:hypothetical protein